MTTRTKLIVAGAILAALVGLVALDIATSKKKRPGGPTPAGGEISIRERPAHGPGRQAYLPPDRSRARPPAPGRTDTTPTETLRIETGARAQTPAGTQEPSGLDRSAPAELRAPTAGTNATIPAPNKVHTVQAGESLWVIAGQHYGDGRHYGLIEQANPGIRPTALRPGQQLQIPPLPARAGAEAGTGAGVVQTADGRFYVVSAGDTLEAIAIHVYGSAAHAAALYEANRGGIRHPDALAVGTRLRIPEIASVRPVAPADVAGQGVAGGRVYVVQSGDCLWKIAQREGVPNRDVQGYIDAIVRANPEKLRSPQDPILTGWQIRLPPR